MQSGRLGLEKVIIPQKYLVFTRLTEGIELNTHKIMWESDKYMESK